MDKEEKSFLEEIKQNRRRKKLKIGLALFSGFLIWGLIASYFLTPVGKSGNVRLSGTIDMEKKDVNAIIHNDGSDLLLFYETEKAEKLLKNHPLIAAAEVRATPFALKIKIEEITPLCYLDGKLLFTDGTNKDEYADDPVFAGIVENYVAELPEFYPAGLALNQYAEFFRPLDFLDYRTKKYLDGFMPIDGSLLAYRFLVDSPSFRFSYGFEILVDDLRSALQSRLLSLCVDQLEISFKNGERDYLKLLKNVKINNVDRDYIKVSYSHKNKNFVIE